MKKLIPVLALVIATASYAEEKKSAGSSYGSAGTKSYNLHANPLGLLFGVANLNFDFKLSDNFALGVGASYFRYTYLTTSATSIGFSVAGTWFPSHDAFTTGLFVRPEVGYAFASVTGASASGIAIGANVGYWWFWEGGFNLGLGGGLSYYGVNYGNLIAGAASSSVGPTLMANIGYAF